MTMAKTVSSESNCGQFVRANGVDIHYYEAGIGPDLLLLHGGVVSANPIWNGFPIAYASFMDQFSESFRVIAPDTRGAGGTVNASGRPPSFNDLADDVAALAEALQLENPAICGFSEGGTTASIVGIRHPNLASAIVNDAGFDLFNPNAPSYAMLKQILGGSPEATRADPSATERMFRSTEQMSTVFDVMVADHDGGQGSGHWRTYLEMAFDRNTQPIGFTVDDLGVISVPTLILVGDRDNFCSPEEAVCAYQSLQIGELAIMPNVEHVITPSKVRAAIDFLRRHLASDDSRDA